MMEELPVVTQPVKSPDSKPPLTRPHVCCAEAVTARTTIVTTQNQNVAKCFFISAPPLIGVPASADFLTFCVFITICALFVSILFVFILTSFWSWVVAAVEDERRRVVVWESFRS